MNLQEQIKEFQKGLLSQVPEETLKSIFAATDKLVKSGLAEKALKKGNQAPAFSLPNAKEELVSSSELLKKGPLVLNFYRGGWCPYCDLELRAYQKILPEIEKLGAQLIAISPNLPDKSLSTGEKNSLDFGVLSDVENKVARKFGLVFTLAEELRPIYKQFGFDIPGDNGDDSYEIPIPATYVVDSNGAIILAYVDADYTKRLEPAEVIKTLKTLNEKNKK